MGSGEGKSSVELRDESVSNSVLTKRSMFLMKEVGESFGRREMWRRVMKSIRIALLSDKINLLIPCGPLAMLVDHLTNHHGWVFFLSLLGIIPLEMFGLGYRVMIFHFFLSVVLYDAMINVIDRQTKILPKMELSSKLDNFKKFGIVK
nr:vacuolar cation/proton exchanger 3-like isoform X1 [Tanacetum cinerariifolium]